MEKTISITIGRVVFMIEEDAYDRLDKYLSTLKKHFASLADSQEIIADIESRIAEKFSEKIKEGKRQAVNLLDVEEVIASMGEASDMSKEEEESRKEKSSQEEKGDSPKRFFRNSDDIMIAGVASGLAAYFGIDPVIIRLIFVLLTVFGGGSGILIYIILWVITPEAKTASEKLEIRGKPVTIEKIEKSVKETLEKSKINKTEVRRFANRFAEFLRKIFSLFAKVLSKFFPIVAMIIGIAFIVSGVLSIFGICFAAAAAIFNFNSPYFSSPWLSQFGGTALYNISVASLACVALIPLVFIFLLGTTLVSRKNSFNVFLTSFLLAIWMFAIIAVGVLGLRFAPEIKGKIEQINNVPAIETARDFKFDNFDRIRADGLGELVIEQSRDFSVSVEGASDDVAKIMIEVKDGELRISHDSSGFARATRIKIFMPELNNLSLNSLTKAKIGHFKQSNLFLEMNGMAKADIDVEIADRLVVSMNDLAELNIKGSVRVSEVKLHGSSRYNAGELSSGYGNFRLEGVSRANVKASEYIKIESYGASYCSYAGGAKAETYSRDMSKIESK
jgi:phage shock protein PspC (stress-responsive transcriptional regulator)